MMVSGKIRFTKTQFEKIFRLSQKCKNAKLRHKNKYPENAQRSLYFGEIHISTDESYK